MKARCLYLYLPLLLPMLFSGAGCSLFQPGGEEKPPAHIVLNQNRLRTITASGKFICLIDEERPPAQQMIQDIIRIAERSALVVEFRPIPYSLRIPSLLRAGKADIAIGNYTVKDAGEKYLDHLTIRENMICLLRKDDTDWKKILASGIAIPDLPKQKK